MGKSCLLCYHFSKLVTARALLLVQSGTNIILFRCRENCWRAHYCSSHPENSNHFWWRCRFWWIGVCLSGSSATCLVFFLAIKYMNNYQCLNQVLLACRIKPRWVCACVFLASSRRPRMSTCGEMGILTAGVSQYLRDPEFRTGSMCCFCSNIYQVVLTFLHPVADRIFSPYFIFSMTHVLDRAT